MSKSKHSKKKSSLSVPLINREMSFCVANGIKVYPVFKKGKWYIESENNGKIKTFDKEVKNEDISYYMAQTYLFYYDKLKKLNND